MNKPRFRQSCTLALVAVAGCGSRQQAANPALETRTAVYAAETAERARRHDIARAHYESAIALAGDRASVAFACSRFGETLLTWGEYGEGILQLEAAIAADPHAPEPWHNLGVAREHMGDLSSAAEAFGRARELAPSDWRPRISLAKLRWYIATRCFRNPPPHSACHPLVEATRREYRAALAVPLPDPLRTKVQWAIRQLDRPNAGLSADVVPSSPP